MRTKSREAPRTMAQKILLAHGDDEGADGLVEVRVDQVVLAREPNRVLGAAVEAGLSSVVPEVAVAYPPYCVSLGEEDWDPRAPHRVPHEALSLGLLVAQPGAGFASTVHLERFGSPTRLALSDDSRLASCGAAGMLTLPASRGQLSQALLSGQTEVRSPCSIQVSLSGRLRPFVCVRDATLELIRRGLKEAVLAADSRHHAPVILEFAGASLKYFSVSERAVFAALAHQLGAAGALFPSDEKTETFLRDQRRSKAHRSLYADPGAKYHDNVALDLASVEPLLMAENGRIRPVRELEGTAVSQVLLGGDSGISLRDLLAAAALLKSKRADPSVEFLLCPPSRQILELLSRSDALASLLATGARLIEADRRAMTGLLYKIAEPGATLRNADRDPGDASMIASAESLAFAIAHGHIGDPRKFKRPVRVTVPRSLPTEDVLLVRGKDARGGARGKGRVDKRLDEGAASVKSDSFAPPHQQQEWTDPLELSVTISHEHQERPCAFVAESIEDIQWLVDNSASLPHLRAIVAGHIPSALVSILSGLGVLALRADASTLKRLVQVKTLKVPARASWQGSALSLSAEDAQFDVEWLARGAERKWTSRSK